MIFKNNFQELYKKYLKAAIIKSLVYATLISCSVLFVASFAIWIINAKQYWIALTLFGILEIGIFFLFFNIFKPDDKKIAKELDALGLQQRVITMNEFKEDSSLMARIQRQNAIDHIKKVDTKLIKVALPTLVIIFTCIAVLFGAASTTVVALSGEGVIAGGKEIIEDIIPAVKKQFEVEYDCDGDGFITGEMFQIVYEGEDATGVLAEAEDGWAFVGWSDGWDNPYRQDKALVEDLKVTAIFMETEEQDGEGEPGEGEPGEGEGGEGEPGESGGDQEGENQPGEDPGEGPGGGEGGKYEPNNQVIDGETYYGDSTYDNAYNDAMENLQQNGEMSDEMKKIIGDYYKNIEK